MSSPRCPDGGYCSWEHNQCEPHDCFRVRSCGPLSGVFENDEWPEDALSPQRGKLHTPEARERMAKLEAQRQEEEERWRKIEEESLSSQVARLSDAITEANRQITMELGVSTEKALRAFRDMGEAMKRYTVNTNKQEK